MYMSGVKKNLNFHSSCGQVQLNFACPVAK